MSSSFLEACTFAAPVIVAGALHVAVIRSGWFSALAHIPLDGGQLLRGRRIFGDHKTLRGLVVMVAAAGLAGAAEQALMLPARAPGGALSSALLSGSVWGSALGFGYILGELPNSFVKRQLDIAPGKTASGISRFAFWLLDQVDSLIGVLVVAWFFAPIPWGVIGWLVAVTLVVHPAFAFLMVVLGLKDRVG